MDTRENNEKNAENRKSPKKKYNLRTRTQQDKKTNYKMNPPQSDSDSDSDWTPARSENITSDSEDTGEENEEKDEMDTRELQKFIQKIFPSKSGQERIRQLEKIDELVEKNKKKSTSTYTPKNRKKKKKVMNKKQKNYERRHKSKKNIQDAGEKVEAEMLKEEEEIDEAELEEMLQMQNMKFNIIFTVGGGQHDNYMEDGDEISDSSDDEAENETNKESFKKGEKVTIKLCDWDQYYPGKIKKVNANGKYNIVLDDNTYEMISDVSPRYIKSITKTEHYESLINEIEELSNIRDKKGKKAMMGRFRELSEAAEKKKEQEQKEKDKKEQNKNVIKFRRLLKDKNVMNDFRYFGKMPVKKQKDILAKLKEVNAYYSVEKPYRLSLLELDIPVSFKSQALKKINTLSYMDPASSEYYKKKQWVDSFMSIPFGQHQTLPIRLSDGKEKCSEFMENAKKILDECVYGLDDAKMQILQYVGQWISNPDTTGTAIAIKGPPGTGKTTLIKEGISKILQRPFAFIALGGATDSSFLEGHSYTYEGSTWGKIVDILIQSKKMNPVIFMDELDKISDTPKGEEITGILTHLTDTAQNDKFHDKYFANVDFDLSRALFIFSYNDESKVNPILKDRLYRIHTDGYKKEQKIIIAKQYLIPKIEQNINFEKDNIIIPEETITYLIENYTENEKGVRNLKRCLEIIYTKLNLYRLMKPGSSLFDKESTLNVTFPYTITQNVVGKLIKKGDDNGTPFGMYM